MKNVERSKEQLLQELTELREEVAELRRNPENAEWLKAAYDALVETIPENVFVKDANSVYVDGNAAYAAQFDLAPEDLPGKTDYDLNPPDQVERYRNSDQRVMEKGEVEHTEITYERKGEQRWSRSIKAPVKDEEGNVIGILGLFNDITEEKQTENQLHIKDQAIEAMNSGFALFDLDAEVQYANPALMEMLGYEGEGDLQDRPLASICEDPVCAASVIAEVKEKGHSRGEVVLEQRDNTKILADVSASLLTNESGKPFRIVTTLIDITDQKRIEEELSNIFNMSLDMICIADMETATFTRVNPAFTEILGYSEEELLSQPFLNFIHPDDVDPTNQVVAEQLKKGKVVVAFENRYRHKEGGYRWLRWVSRPDPETGTIYAVAHDITDQKKTEQELREHRDDLEKMVEERTQKIREQTEEILELSTPTMQVWDGILVAPLIGTLDSRRTQRFMEVLLTAIVDTGSEIALIDLTGVPTIDTQTARFIIETIEAVRLLGADVILTGVRPSIAQTLVHLSIDLSGITTRSSLGSGLRVALKSLSLEVNAHE